MPAASYEKGVGAHLIFLVLTAEFLYGRFFLCYFSLRTSSAGFFDSYIPPFIHTIDHHSAHRHLVERFQISCDFHHASHHEYRFARG